MCTAYELGKRGGSFPEWLIAETLEHLRGLDKRIVRPTLPAPVVMPDGSLREMLWGFRRPVPGGKTKQLWRTIVNSREDKLTGRTWSKAFQERRCLIPAAAFCEWTDGAKGKVPLRFEESLDRWVVVDRRDWAADKPAMGSFCHDHPMTWWGIDSSNTLKRKRPALFREPGVF